ncbi:hypothetical protein [Archangium sp.]|uniref:hypothetical protein n=1 Tax=Archangium sp. TaxID=1872627 RepID=UPI002D3A4029|nr:hypothetical protein [Archangium sp.]HYO59777.1 hypothetical protein [Archangium sp.]
MRIYEILADAARFAASRWQAAVAQGREEEKRLWSYVGESRNFVHMTGQVYRFEDYLEGLAPGAPPTASPALSAGKGGFSRPAVELFLEVLDEVPEPEQKQHVRVLIALLDFIADTGQTDDVEDFFINHQQYAPIAVAQFASRDEAEAWLMGVAEPPSPAYILIGDDYHQLWYMREDNTRGMYRDYVIEPIIKALTAKGIPPGAPSFHSRTEAEEWLKSHPAAPEAFVVIAGEYYLAVHHKRLKRHTLHHVASALREWEERKRTVEFGESREAGAPPAEEGE